MTGSLGVMAVLLLEAAAGGSVALWASRMHGRVRRGFFLLTGIALAICAWASWALTANVVEALRADGADDALAARMTGPEGRALLTALAVFAGLMVLWQVLLVIRDNAVARAVGLAASVAGVAALVLFGLARGGDPLFAVAELVAGAAFLGTTFFGFLLGHWYMVERRMDTRFMVRGAWFYIAGVVAAVASVALSARNAAPDVTAVASPLLAIPGFSVLLGGGLIAICGMIAGFVWKLAHEGGRSIQAATGYMYLALILAFSAELAAKFRYF